jgi:hypothetical protein
MKKVYALVLALVTFTVGQAQISAALGGSCTNGDGTIDIAYDATLNCASESLLTGNAAAGFHSGANNFGILVAWDDAGAVSLVNDGTDTFRATIDLAAYYGAPLATISNVQFVANQGATVPSDPWSVVGRDTTPGGFGCEDLLITIADLPTCAGAAACDASNAPTGLSSTVNASNVSLNWSPIPNSIACEVQGGPVGGGTGKLRVFGSSLAGTTVPGGALSSATYEWRVRCACSVPPAPIDATPLSAPDTFVWPAPRMGEVELGKAIFPNPATDMVVFMYDAEVSEEVQLRIVDGLGRTVLANVFNVEAGSTPLSLDISDLPNGTYYVSAGQSEATPFVVAH